MWRDVGNVKGNVRIPKPADDGARLPKLLDARDEMIGSLLLSETLSSKFFSVLFLGKLHVSLMRMCFPSVGCWDLGEVSRSKPK